MLAANVPTRFWPQATTDFVHKKNYLWYSEDTSGKWSTAHERMAAARQRKAEAVADEYSNKRGRPQWPHLPAAGGAPPAIIFALAAPHLSSCEDSVVRLTPRYGDEPCVYGEASRVELWYPPALPHPPACPQHTANTHPLFSKAAAAWHMARCAGAAPAPAPSQRPASARWCPRSRIQACSFPRPDRGSARRADSERMSRQCVSNLLQLQ